MGIEKIISKNIKAIRKDMKMTQKQVAQGLNMTQQQYSRFENAKYELNYHQLYELCILLQTTPNEIFGFDD